MLLPENRSTNPAAADAAEDCIKSKLRMANDSILQGLTPGQRDILLRRMAELTRQKRVSEASNQRFDSTRVEPRVAPLSYAQQRLWFIQQLQPEGAAYNTPFAARLQGKLDRQALENGLQEIVNRHETLRTCFPSRDGMVIQEIREAAVTKLELMDLRALPQSDQTAEAEKCLKEDASRPFDLERPPLLRAKLIQVGEQEHILVVTVHHIACDGLSASILVRELLELYQSFARHESPRLPQLKAQYRDFVQWQRKWLSDDKLNRQLEYWKAKLEGAKKFELPTDYPRSDRMNDDIGILPVKISRELAKGLKGLSQREGVTLFMTLMAALHVLLGWYARQTDVALGTDISNRSQSDFEPLIGLFVNQLVIRTDLQGNPRLVDVLGRVKSVLLEAYAHQDLPFDKLVEAVAPERQAHRSPLVDVKLVFYGSAYRRESPAHVSEEKDDQLTITGNYFRALRAKFDLIFDLSDGEDQISGTMEYRSELFATATMRLLRSRFLTVLATFAESPYTDLDSLRAMLDKADETQARETSRVKLASIRRKPMTL